MGRPDLQQPGYHGTQNRAVWAAGQAGPRSLCSLGQPPASHSHACPPVGLWQISAQVIRTQADQPDAPTLDITWGAGHSSGSLSGVLLPALFLVPGFAVVQAVLAGAATAGLSVVCQVSPVYGPACCPVVRTLHTGPGGAGVQLGPTVRSVVAMDAVSVQPFGAPGPIALAVGERLDASAPTTLISGTVYAEHVL